MNEIDELTTLLMNAGGVISTPYSYNAMTFIGTKRLTYNIPVGYRFVVDFEKLAKAVIDGGYRKEINNGDK